MKTNGLGPSSTHFLAPLSRVEDSATLMDGETDFKELLYWRLEWRKDSEYQGKTGE